MDERLASWRRSTRNSASAAVGWRLFPPTSTVCSNTPHGRPSMTHRPRPVPRQEAAAPNPLGVVGRVPSGSRGTSDRAAAGDSSGPSARSWSSAAAATSMRAPASAASGTISGSFPSRLTSPGWAVRGAPASAVRHGPPDSRRPGRPRPASAAGARRRRGRQRSPAARFGSSPGTTHWWRAAAVPRGTGPARWVATITCNAPLESASTSPAASTSSSSRSTRRGGPAGRPRHSH